MLREFEDKENLLAEMDEQVDAYREAGKEEAATRLEDQLTLIHTRFQVREEGEGSRADRRWTRTTAILDITADIPQVTNNVKPSIE